MHRLPDDNEDNAPFPDLPGGPSKGKQLYRLPEPLLVGEPSLQGYLRLLRDSSERHQGLSEAILIGEESISDFSHVPPVFDESTFESLDVTIAREKHRPRVPDPAEASRFSICLLLRNKYFGTF